MKLKYFKVKILKAVSKKRCTMCRKRLDMWDEQEYFCIDRTIGYGSKYDGCRVKLQLCCDCFDKVLDTIVPQCKASPISDPYEEMYKLQYR